MKKILYTRPDGGLSVVSLAAGARLAFAITLANGTRLSQPEIVKLAVLDKDGKVLEPAQMEDVPQPADRFLRGWPISGAEAEWAETEDAFVARVAASVVPADAQDMQIVDEAALPGDRTFRDAWQHVGGVVDVHIGRAREIHKTRLRELRAPKLAALDVEYQKADEKGDGPTKAAIAQKKQALRDVTKDPAIDDARTPEELVAFLPEILA